LEDAKEKVEEELDDDTWEDIQRKREKRRKPPPKSHDPELQAKIDNIRWIGNTTLPIYYYQYH
jgi:hypothetical protein